MSKTSFKEEIRLANYLDEGTNGDKIQECKRKLANGEELTLEEKRIIEEENEMVKILQETEEEPNSSQALLEYNRFVDSQRDGFIAIMNLTNDIINKLIDDGKISDFVEIRARIKAPESAIRNDSKKALDDIFGIEIIGATEEELTVIINHLKYYMANTKSRDHDKKNGYKARHRFLILKKDKINLLNTSNKDKNYLPPIEFQFKTMAVTAKCNGGTADHMKYKSYTKEEIQQKYDAGKMTIFTDIPIMWVSDKSTKKMRLLTENEILKKLYPFLKLKQPIDIDKTR